MFSFVGVGLYVRVCVTHAKLYDVAEFAATIVFTVWKTCGFVFMLGSLYVPWRRGQSSPGD